MDKRILEDNNIHFLTLLIYSYIYKKVDIEHVNTIKDKIKEKMKKDNHNYPNSILLWYAYSYIYEPQNILKSELFSKSHAEHLWKRKVNTNSLAETKIFEDLDMVINSFFRYKFKKYIGTNESYPTEKGLYKQIIKDIIKLEKDIEKYENRNNGENELSFFIKHIRHHIINYLVMVEGDEDIKKIQAYYGLSYLGYNNLDFYEKNAENIQLALNDTINYIIYEKYKEDNVTTIINNEYEFYYEKLFSNSVIEYNEKNVFDKKYIVKEMSSYDKGVISEKVFGLIYNAEIVGHKNNKTDAILNDVNISIKTTFNDKWNNHLSYINSKDEEMDKLNVVIENNELFSKSDINWLNVIKKSITNNEVSQLVFQKINIDDDYINDVEIWKIDIAFIENLIAEKNYFFQKNNMFITYDGEVIFKLSFKQRSVSNQIMISTDIDSLNLLIDICAEYEFHNVKDSNLKNDKRKMK